MSVLQLFSCKTNPRKPRRDFRVAKLSSPVQETSAHQYGFIETERKTHKLVETSF
jgi:hypothetical protein